MTELTLEAAWYGRAALEAAASALAGRALVSTVTVRGKHRVTIEPLKRVPEAPLVGLYLDEALNHQLREEVVALNRPVAGPVLAQVYMAGFAAVPKDPLEEMDKQLAAERAAETAALLAEASGKPATLSGQSPGAGARRGRK